MLPPAPHGRPRQKWHSARLAAAAFVTVPLLPLLPAVAAPAHADTVRGPLAELRDDIDAILEDPSLEGAVSGVIAVDPDTGESLYSRDTETQLLPASNMKLFSGAAALEVLGSEHTFTTEVTAENRQGDRVDDLYLVGAGDPTLSEADLDALAADVAASGVTAVTGDLYADDTWFDDERLVDDWWPEDEPYAYSAQISALTLAHGERHDTGVTEVVVTPGAEGDTVGVDLGAADGYVSLDNRAVTGAEGSANTLGVDRPVGTNTIEVTGSLPVGEGPVEELRTVDEPAGLAGHAFAEALENNGVSVKGETGLLGGVPDDWESAETLADHTSPELAQILVPFMKFSNNAHAEMLVKSIGREVADEGSWDAGLAGVEGSLAALGVDTGDLVLNDGSGLSRGNWISAATIVDLLVQARGASWAEEFRLSLPVAGEEDPFVGGTLAGRMGNTPAEGVVKAKTGTMTGVSALSGYVPGPDGGEVVFGVVNNDHAGPAPTEVQDAIAVRLAEYLGHEAPEGVVAQRGTVPGSGELECSWERVC